MNTVSYLRRASIAVSRSSSSTSDERADMSSAASEEAALVSWIARSVRAPTRHSQIASAARTTSARIDPAAKAVVQDRHLVEHARETRSPRRRSVPDDVIEDRARRRARGSLRAERSRAEEVAQRRVPCRDARRAARRVRAAARARAARSSRGRRPRAGGSRRARGRRRASADGAMSAAPRASRGGRP